MAIERDETMFTIRKKLYLSFSVILCILIGLCAYSAYSMQTISGQLTLLAYNGMPGVANVNAIDTAESDYRLAEYALIASRDAAQAAKAEQSRAKIASEIEAAMTNYEKTIDAEQDRALFAQAKADWSAYLKASEKTVALYHNPATKETAKSFLEDETNALFLKASSSVGELTQYNIAQGKVVSDAGESSYQTGMWLLGLFTGVAVLFAVAIAFFLSRNIHQSVTGILHTSEKVAKGDLRDTIHIRSNDEMGQLANSYNQMLQNVKTLIGNIQNTAEQVAASSEQLTAGADQSAQATQNIAQNIGQVSAASQEQIEMTEQATGAMDEIASGVKEVTASAQTAAQHAADAASLAADGTKAIRRAIQQIQTIETTVSDSTQVVTSLGEQSQEIGKIVETISGIAGQTNLLALNAAIEAARAGEQGKGFAVVAEEVRKLAEQSKTAAEQIAKLITGIQTEMEKAVSSMQSGTKEVEIGTTVVNEAGAAFSEITKMAAQVSEQVGGISKTVESVATQTNGIVSAIQGIDAASKNVSGKSQSVAAATEEQSASMQQIAASSKSLATLAESLQQAAHKFNI